MINQRHSAYITVAEPGSLVAIRVCVCPQQIGAASKAQTTLTVGQTSGNAGMRTDISSHLHTVLCVDWGTIYESATSRRKAAAMCTQIAGHTVLRSAHAPCNDIGCIARAFRLLCLNARAHRSIMLGRLL